jgi:hypothetical protein
MVHPSSLLVSSCSIMASIRVALPLFCCFAVFLGHLRVTTSSSNGCSAVKYQAHVHLLVQLLSPSIGMQHCFVSWRNVAF